MERAGHEAQSVRLLAFAAFDAQACVIFFVAVTTKSVARHAGLFRLIQHTASLMCSWRRRLPSSDGLKKRGRQPGSSNFIQRFGTVANSRASSLRQNLRRLWAMRSAPPSMAWLYARGIARAGCSSMVTRSLNSFQ